ncbi:MAG: ATP-binding protein [Nitrospirae bacterium]|nr:MAG: ATP-binding protein [Nitrospirota bacterium]
MIKRTLISEIKSSLKTYPVVGILGSRQVGKTTLAKIISSSSGKKAVYLDLELPSDNVKLSDPELYLGQFPDRLVIIDEIQRMPTLFPLLRALVDQKRTAGRFLILGSASLELIRHSSESLAGRIIYHELSPCALEEVGFENMDRLWLRGGYPESFLAANDEKSMRWREAFIRTYLEMDIPQLGIRIPSVQLRRFWTMVAHVHGRLWNASQISNSLDISAPTAKKYLDILEETFVVRQLQPFHHNIKKRLVKTPKVLIRDSGLLHALLKIPTLDDLQGHPSAGSSWEGFAIEQVLNILPDDRQAYFYRTSAGAEIDLVILDRRNIPVAIEIKHSLSPKLTKGFWLAFEDLKCNKGFVIYPGTEKYPLTPKVTALPLKNIREAFKTLK